MSKRSALSNNYIESIEEKGSERIEGAQSTEFADLGCVKNRGGELLWAEGHTS
jgi:hypothetical protein